MNIVISQINDQKADEALALIGKLMIQFPTDMTLYYRRRAHLAAEKLPEAKADLEVRRGCAGDGGRCPTRRRFSSR